MDTGDAARARALRRQHAGAARRAREALPQARARPRGGAHRRRASWLRSATSSPSERGGSGDERALGGQARRSGAAASLRPLAAAARGGRRGSRAGVAAGDRRRDWRALLAARRARGAASGGARRDRAPMPARRAACSRPACSESCPRARRDPRSTVSLPERGLSGYEARLEVVLTHAAGETVLPEGFHVQRDSDAARADRAGRLRHPRARTAARPRASSRSRARAQRRDHAQPAVRAACPRRPAAT